MHKQTIAIAALGLVLVVLLVTIGSMHFSHLPRHTLSDSSPSTGRSDQQLAVSLKYGATIATTTVVNAPAPTTGCGQSIAPLRAGATTLVTMTSAGVKRSYLIYVPTNYSNLQSHAVVLNFHGYGANAQLQEVVSHFDSVADSNKFIVVYPNGSYGKSGKRGWNTGLHPGIMTNDTLFVSNLLTSLQQNLCIQPTQIYATGFSNGGGFVNLLACTMSSRIAAFAPIAGSYVTPSQDCKPTRPVSLIAFSGTADNVNPLAGSRRKHEPSVQSWLNGWLARDGCAPIPERTKASATTTRSSWSGCNANAAVESFTIDGGTHLWPTGLLVPIHSRTGERENVATIIWQFFSEHPLSAS